jgi:type I restriction enzyme S subunit
MRSKVLFGEIAKFSNGKTSPEREDSGAYNVFGSNGIIGKSNSTNTEKEIIIIGRVGSYCGSVYFSKDKCWITDNAIKCEAKDENIPLFIYYQAVKLNLNNFRVGSGQPLLNQGILNGLEVNYFMPKTQKKIAHILSTLDDKIELNRKMNQTLETMAQTLFKSWFVDFDPVHVKLTCKSEEELEHAAKELGISKEILELFPNEFEESELGMIPKGWEVKELISLVQHIKPGTNYQPERVSSGIPFVNGKHIQYGFLNLNDINYITREEYERVHKVWKPEAYDVLITRIGTLGKIGVILESDLPLALHYNSINVKTSRLSHQFLYFLFKSDFFQKQFHMYKKHAVQEFITIEAVEQLKIVLPHIDETIRQFNEYFKNIFDNIENYTIQINTLQKTRDTLLPKLLSGEIDVSELEI